MTPELDQPDCLVITLRYVINRLAVSDENCYKMFITHLAGLRVLLHSDDVIMSRGRNARAVSPADI